MAEAEAATPVAPTAELLEWPKKDKRRFLHVVYRVGDLDRTIKYSLMKFLDFLNIFFIFVHFVS